MASQDFPPAYQQLPRLSKPFDLPDLERALKALTGYNLSRSISPRPQNGERGI